MMQVTVTNSSASVISPGADGREHCRSTPRHFWCGTQRNNNRFNSKVHFILAISIRFHLSIKKPMFALCAGTNCSLSLWQRFPQERLADWKSRWQFVHLYDATSCVKVIKRKRQQQKKRQNISASQNMKIIIKTLSSSELKETRAD